MSPEKDFAAGIDRLFALIPADLHTQVDPTPAAAIYGWGALFNVFHYARGIKALHEAGCCASVAPLMRSLLEYTMGTLWLADAGDDAVEIINRRTIYSHGQLNKAMDNAAGLAGWREKIPPEVVANFEETVATDLGPHADEYLGAFAHLLREYDFPEWIPVYNVLSTISHLSGPGAYRFYVVKPGATLLGQEPLIGEFAPCLDMAFGLVLDAMAAYDRAFLIGSPWAHALAEIAAEYEAEISHAKRRPKATA